MEPLCQVSPAPAVRLGRGEPEEAGFVELPLPVPAEVVHFGSRHLANDRAGGAIRREVRREPRAHLGAESLLLGSEPEIHRSSGARNRATPVYSTRPAPRDERGRGARAVPRPAACTRAAPMPSSP